MKITKPECKVGLGNISVEYNRQVVPIKRIICSDLETQRKLVCQPSQTERDSVTMYMASLDGGSLFDARIRLTRDDAYVLIDQLKNLLRQMGDM